MEVEDNYTTQMKKFVERMEINKKYFIKSVIDDVFSLITSAKICISLLDTEHLQPAIGTTDLSVTIPTKTFSDGKTSFFNSHQQLCQSIHMARFQNNTLVTCDIILNIRPDLTISMFSVVPILINEKISSIRCTAKSIYDVDNTIEFVLSLDSQKRIKEVIMEPIVWESFPNSVEVLKKYVSIGIMNSHHLKMVDTLNKFVTEFKEN